MLVNFDIGSTCDVNICTKQDQVNNANSAFILINCLVSQGLKSSLIGPGGPGDLGGQGGPGSPGGPCGRGGAYGLNHQIIEES